VLEPVNETAWGSGLLRVGTGREARPTVAPSRYGWSIVRTRSRCWRASPLPGGKRRLVRSVARARQRDGSGKRFVEGGDGPGGPSHFVSRQAYRSGLCGTTNVPAPVLLTRRTEAGTASVVASVL
jgi:hypothetical protein